MRVIDPASSQLFPSEVVVGEPAEGEWGRLDWKPVNDGIGLAGEMLACRIIRRLGVHVPAESASKPVAKWLQELAIPRGALSHLPVFLVENDPV